MNRKYFILILTTVVIVLLDILTKAYITSNLFLHESVGVIDGFFNITYVRNPGAAFGFLAGASPVFRSLFFGAITVAVIILIVYYIVKNKAGTSLESFSLSLILSGALGNLIDRVRFGEVIDFLDVYIGSHHWPAFNVADSAITVGAVLMIADLLLYKKKDNAETMEMTKDSHRTKG